MAEPIANLERWRGRGRSLVPALALLFGCDTPGSVPADAGVVVVGSAIALEAAEEETDLAPPDPSDQERGAAKAAGERVSVPAGSFRAGSTPGDRGRDPVLEPALLEVELAAFEIDRLPYPNDPARAPLTGKTRAEAQKLCIDAGARLCTELEWERACKGPDGDPYPGGDRWLPECAARPETCASGFGVLAMGAANREWTASEVLPIKELQPGAAAVRGATASAADVDHRCARRTAVAPDIASGDLGFRCCRGDAPDTHIPSPDWLPAFRKTELPPERLGAMFAELPKLAALSKGIKYFQEEAAGATVVRRAEGRAPDGGSPVPPYITLGTAPMLWNPVPGEVILLVTGQVERDSFIVAFHEVGEGRYRVGAAVTFEDEPGPIVFAYNRLTRRKLHWSLCWGCYGEGGTIAYRQDNSVVITQE